MAKRLRGIMAWSVMRASVRFSDGVRPKAGAACTICSGRGVDARFRSGDWAPGPPPGPAREITASSKKHLLPTTEEDGRHWRMSGRPSASLDSTAT